MPRVLLNARHVHPRPWFSAKLTRRSDATFENLKIMDISVESPSSSFPPSHISQLPPELLAKIFLHLADALRPEAKAMGYSDCRPYAWLPVTRVCCFWHDAALRCPSLWAFIDISHPVERIRMLLARSGRVPLILLSVSACESWAFSLRFLSFDGIVQGILAVVLQEVPRITKLDVMIPRPLSAKFAVLTQRPAPMLRSPCIKNIPLLDSHPEEHFPLNFDVPHLRSLKVFGFKLSKAKTLLRPSLRKLVLDVCECPPLREVSECIRELPLLSSLDFRGFNYFYHLGGSGTDYPKDYEAVTLNHLQWLHIKGSRHYSRFLRDLEVAPGATLFLEMSTGGMDGEVEDIDMMISRAVTFCGLQNHNAVLPPSRMLRSVLVQYKVDSEHRSGVIMEIRGWDVVLSHDVIALAIEHPRSHPRPFLHLKLTYSFTGIYYDMEALSYLCRHFDFKELRTLISVFNARTIFDDDVIGHGLADIFDSPSIETLIMLDWSAKQLAALITTGDCNFSIQSPDDPLPSRIPPIPFSGLKTLITYDLFWDTDEASISPSSLRLSTALKYRAKNNVEIETLFLGCGSNIDREDLDKPIAVVPSSMWNVREERVDGDNSICYASSVSSRLLPVK
ncbi:unnamed protein product [Somion occarium]|uniref:F-box domain-containing protein n=1 Tax=Somion occarium TaxID=3059160 RepID=A0ABP1CSI6_9APHY